MFTDFQYGDELASDYGLYVVKFDSSSGGSETISSGSTLTFNSVKSVGQDVSELYGSTYDENYSFTIQLCRLDNHCNPLPIMPEEYGAINRWLNRKTFDQFKINKELALIKKSLWWKGKPFKRRTDNPTGWNDGVTPWNILPNTPTGYIKRKLNSSKFGEVGRS